MDFILNILTYGIPYALIALGVFISYRVLDFPDMTTEGSFVLGGAMSLVLIYVGVNPWLATLIAILSGAIAGIITGLLHTKLKINGLLSGIITLTMLFSINMVVFGAALAKQTKTDFSIIFSNSTKVQLVDQKTIFAVFDFVSKDLRIGCLIMMFIILLIVFLAIYYFFGTEVGMSMRACGMNQKMSRTQGINTNFYIIFGLALANSIIALAGSLYAQRDESFFSTSGTGMLVVGLASIIIGEAIFGKRDFLNWLISVSLGGIVYYMIVYIAIQLGMPDHLLKLLYGIIIIIILAMSLLNKNYNLRAKILHLFKKENKTKDEILISNTIIDSSDKEINVHDNVILSLKNVTKKFNSTGNDEDLKIALNEVSVDIKEGEFVTIIGSNGSGKTTFFNTISGVYNPDSGHIYINGNDVTKEKEHQRAKYIGRVTQDPFMGTAKDMSILENLNIAYRRDKTKTLKWGFKKSDELMFKSKLKEFNLDLENRVTQKIGKLSGGQRQAVTLLMATIKRPEILFLDEHTAALDPKTAVKVLNLTDNIVKNNNLTCVMVTHNMKDAIKYGNRLLMFDKGKIIYDVKGEEKKNLTVESLLNKFENLDFNDDKILS